MVRTAPTVRANSQQRGVCSWPADCERRDARQPVNRGVGFTDPDRRASKGASSLTRVQGLEPTPAVFHGVEPEAGNECTPPLHTARLPPISYERAVRTSSSTQYC